MVFTSFFVSLKIIDDVREMTRRDRTFDRSAITSSVRPSAKYAFSGSMLRFVNGSTAIDGTDPDPALPWALAAARGPGCAGRVSRHVSISDHA